MTKLVAGITGAMGFVGSAVLRAVAERHGHEAVALLRSTGHDIETGSVEVREIGALEGLAQSNPDLVGLDVVIHCAARVHVMNDTSMDSLAEFRRINVEGTTELARKCAGAGVRRFVFISSIKVNGEQTAEGRPFSAEDMPAPSDPYGISKAEAEQKLMRLAEETGMEVVVIRPPLVYGPGVKGNFATMLRIVDKGIPLPLGAVKNKRSMVSLGNLVDLIITCTDHPAAGNQVFLASDGEDLSTSELLREIGRAKGKAVRLLPVPQCLLMFVATALAKKSIAQRVLGSLQVDITKTKELLGWCPPLSVAEGIRQCV